jgi:heparan-alpha-glucosaminide N-acetyltransferase
MKAKLPSTRIQSIDAFRGITIFVMIFVNEVAGVSGLPSWMKHAGADDDAMTFVDVVFPAFLFIVGMSIPFALRQRLEYDGDLRQAGHTVWRAISLMIMGVFMVNAEGGYDETKMGLSIHAWSLLFYLAVCMIWININTHNNVYRYALRGTGLILLFALASVYVTEEGGSMTPRWWGILGLIGWAYLIACATYWISGGRGWVIMIMIAFFFAYYLLGHFAFPGNIFFQHILLSQGGHAVHAAIVLSGVLLSLIFFRIDLLVTPRQRITEAAWLAVFMLIAGALLRPLTTLSKIYATPAWAAFSVAACIFVFAVIYVLTEQLKLRRWTTLVNVAAVNPLMVYIIPFIVYAAMKLTGISFPGFLYEGAVGIVWALVYAAIVMAIGSVLTWVGAIIKI